MNYKKNIFVAILAMCHIAQIAADCSGVTPYYSPRSQGSNAARQMVGWEDLINQCNKDYSYGAFAVALDYSQTFKSDKICQCLFGSATETAGCKLVCPTTCAVDCEGCSIKIAGSCVTDRDSNAWLADYFGLSSDFQSIINFSPKVRTFVADLEFYVGFDQWVEGLFLRVNLPITNTKWSLRPNEVVSPTGNSTNYPAGYFSAQQVPRSQLVSRALDFFNGSSAPDLTTGQTIPVLFEPLKFSKWATCESLSTTKLADISMSLGYNIVCNDCGFFGLSLRASAPTGTRPQGEYLFEPIAGNGKHWGLGFGMNSHYELWSSAEDDSSFGFYLDANISHFFKTSQTRSFDLCAQGENSRYMLAQKLGPNTQGLSGNSNQSDKQFTNVFAPIANLTASKVDVKVPIEGEVAFKFAYTTDCGFSWDIGYNFWGKSCEKIKPHCTIDLSSWALKGDAYVYGFADQNNTPVALGATENDATIKNGTGLGVLLPSCNNGVNDGIDLQQPAFVNGTTQVHTFGTTNQTRTSIQPVTLDTDIINYASNRGISHKLFTHLSYTWKDCETWKPFLGIGASAEFGQSCNSGCGDDSSCNTTCSSSCDPDDIQGSCVSCALNQWSVWIKGGVLYN